MRALFAALLLTLTPLATAQTVGDYWLVGVSGGDGGLETVTFVDAARIRVTGSTRRAWVEGYLSPAYVRRHGSEHIVLLDEYDCAEQRTRTLQSTLYHRFGAPHTSGATEWSYAVPNTSGASTLEFVCGSRDPTRYMRVPPGMSPAEAAANLFRNARQQEASPP